MKSNANCRRYSPPSPSETHTLAPAPSQTHTLSCTLSLSDTQFGSLSLSDTHAHTVLSGEGGEYLRQGREEVLREVACKLPQVLYRGTSLMINSPP